MNIKQVGLVISIAIFIIIAIAVNNSTADAAIGTETKISDSIHATSPVVYGNWIVWVDAVGVHGDFGKIFMRNISSGEIRQLETPSYSHSTEYYSPAIHEDRVIWVEETFNGSIIYFYNITTNETSPLIETNVNPDPAIYNDLLVWQDDSNGSWDIYMYNIATGEEQQITKDNTSNQMNPVIYEDIIVWQDDRNYKGVRSHENVEYISEFFRMLQRSDFSQMWDIYMYNISTGEEKQITTHVSNQINPVIYGDTIVWQDYRNWNWDIYMYDLSAEEMKQITTNESVQWGPAIYKDKIAWIDNNRTESYLYREIYMYNISTGKELQVTDWGAEFNYPTETYWRGQLSIYENKIVWSDERGGMENPQVFMFSLGEQRPPHWQEPVDEEPTNDVPAEEDVNRSSEQLNKLQEDISGLDGVDTGTKRSLIANLNNAITMADKGDEGKSIDRLEKLIESIEKQLLPKERLSPEQAEYIIGELERIIEAIRDNNAVTSPNNDSDDVTPPANDTVLRAEGTETLIAYSGGESKSVIYGEWIAWENWRGMSPSEICLYDISSEEQLSLTPVSSQSTEPAIYGDKLIWRDFRHNWTTDYIFEGIFLYDISTGEEIPLIESRNASHPDIYGNKVVWTDRINGDSDIYMYDISTGETEQVTTSGMANSAVIYGDTIAWLDNRNRNAVYTYSISTGEEKQIVSSQNPTHEYPSHLAIHGDRIVWQDHRNWNWDIYMYNLTSGEEVQITTDNAPQTEPSIYGDRIVWTDRRDNGNYEIFMYDISTGKEYRVTDWAETDGIHVGWRRLPSIYQDRIVWFDARYGTQACAIFMFTLGEQTTTDLQGIVNKIVEQNDLVSTIESTTDKIDVNTNEGSIVGKTTTKIVDNITEESPVSNTTVEKLNNTTSVSIEEQTRDAIENTTVGSTEEAGEDENISNTNVAENTIDESSQKPSEWEVENTSDESGDQDAGNTTMGSEKEST